MTGMESKRGSFGTKALIAALLAGMILSCIMEKDGEKRKQRISLGLPDSMRKADSLIVFLEDTLGFGLDTLWNGRATGDSVLGTAPERYAGGRAWVILRAFGPGAFHAEIKQPIEPGQTLVNFRGGSMPVLLAPPDSALDLDTALELRWSYADSLRPGETWRLVLGEDSLRVLKSGLASPRLRISSLEYGRLYTWRVDRVSGLSIVPGPVRRFRTKVEPPRILEYASDGLRFRLGAYKVTPARTYRGGKAFFSSSPALPAGFSLDSLGKITGELMADSLGGSDAAAWKATMALAGAPPIEYTVSAENASGRCEGKVLIRIDSSGAQDEGLVAHWDFEEDGGSVLKDKSGNGHDGVISHGEWTNGVSGKAMWFNGFNSGVRVPFQEDLDQPAYTLEAWIRTTKIEGDQAILDRALPSGSMWNYRMIVPGRTVLLNGLPFPKNVVLSDVRGAFASSIQEVVAGKVFVADGRWHHVVATNRARLISIYVDGKLDTARIAGADPAKTNTTRQDLLLGDSDYPGLNFKFQGAMDEVRIYSYDLDSTEVRARFQSFRSVPKIIDP
jgi:concanavalin A-like lectin/glucanase superfamily protein